MCSAVAISSKCSDSRESPTTKDRISIRGEFSPTFSRGIQKTTAATEAISHLTNKKFNSTVDYNYLFDAKIDKHVVILICCQGDLEAPRLYDDLGEWIFIKNIE